MKATNFVRFPWQVSPLGSRCESLYDLENFTLTLRFRMASYVSGGPKEYTLTATPDNPRVGISLDHPILAASPDEAMGAANVILSSLGFTPKEG